MPCLEATTLASLFSGGLSDEERAGVDDHVDGCTTCRRMIAAVARSHAATEATLSVGEGPGRDALGTAPSTGSQPHVLLEPGDEVSRYVVAGFLGAGAMGAVYRARDPELGRGVALKIVRARGAARADARALRLVREAQAMAKLSHPNIVPVYDAGSSGELMFIAMKEIEGESLRQRLATAKPTASTKDNLRLLLEAGRGLEAAHEAGIVHRDLKPDNILVDHRGGALVGDFGLALIPDDLQDDDGASEPAEHSDPRDFRTAAGTILGTPAYMAPEVRGGATADARSDQYSFAVTLAEALGVRPGEDLDAARMPRHVKRALRRALADDPALRWTSMSALLAALEPRVTLRRAALVVVALGGLAAVLVGWSRGASDLDRIAACKQAAREHLDREWSDEQRQGVADHLLGLDAPGAAKVSDAVLEGVDDYASAWRAMRSDACEATQVRGEQSVGLLDLRMECLDARLVELGVVRRTLADLAASELATAFELGNLLGDLAQCADPSALTRRAPTDAAAAATARVLRAQLTEANATILRGRLSEATSSAPVDYAPALAAVDDALARARAEGLPVLEADALRIRSHLLGKGDGPGSLDDLHASLALGDRLGDPAIRADALIGLLNEAAPDVSRTTEVMLLARLAKSAAAEIPGAQRMRRGRIAGNLGWHLGLTGDLDDAIAKYEEALAAYEAERGLSNPYTLMIQRNLAGILVKAGRVDEAIAIHEAMLAALRETYGDTHPYLVVVLLIEGDTLARVERLDEARAIYERALAMAATVHGPEHPQVAKVLRKLGYLALDHDPPAARAAFARAIALIESVDERPGLGALLVGLGEAELAMGDAAAAVDSLERGLAQEGRARAEQVFVPTARFALARALWQTGGDRRRARELATLARDEYRDTEGPWSPTRDEVVGEVSSWLEAPR